MANTVHLEIPLVSGAILSIDLAGDDPPSAGELALMVRIAEIVDRSAVVVRARGAESG